MAKIVTREFTSTKVTVLGVNPETAEPGNMTFTFTDPLPADESKLYKLLCAKCEGLPFKPAVVVSTEEISELRGMDKDKFYEMSVPVIRPASQSKNKTNN